MTLSTAAVLTGWVLTIFDGQYATSTLAERIGIGLFGGVFGALLVSPLTALVSLIVGGIAAARRRLPSAGPTAANPPTADASGSPSKPAP